MLDLPREELEKFEKDDAIVTKFCKEITTLNDNPQFQAMMSYEERQRLEANTEKRLAYEEGETAGITQGEKQKQIEIAKNFLNDGIAIEIVSKNTGLSIDELQKLKIDKEMK